MRERIDSSGNEKIKLAASLRQKKHRDREQLFLAEGVRLCEMAAESGWKISFCLYTETVLGESRGAALLSRLEERGERLYQVSENVFRKASATESPQGILLVMEQKKMLLRDLTLSGHPFLMVMDGVRDPGNAGAMIRLADAAGMDGVILLKGSVDPFSDKVVRGTMGSLFHLPVCGNVETEPLLDFLKEMDISLYATALDASAQTCYAADLSGRRALAFGSEADGVSAELLRESRSIYIPMFGRAESLNVATASAIVVYEALRQRMEK